MKRHYQPKHSLFCELAALLILVCGCQVQATPLAPTATAIPSATATPTIPPTRTPTPTPQPAPNQQAIFVPLGLPPTIDGVMDSGEWDAALEVSAGDGSIVLFMHSGDALYVGVRGSTPEMIVSNVFIHDGANIRIAHASAALGTAVYQQKGDSWERILDFDWRCRSTSDSEAAREERTAFYRDEGWVATNSRIGTPNALEFMFDMPQEPFSLAVNILRSSNPDSKIAYPADLDDGVISPTPGGLPQVLPFRPELWADVTLEGQ